MLQQRCRRATNYVVVPNCFAGVVLTESLSGNRGGIQMEDVSELGDHRRQSACVEEILHQIGTRRHEVDQQGNVTTLLPEIAELEGNFQPPGDGKQVHHSVGGPTDSRVHLDRILE